MRAMILAAGLGTRLQPLTSELPKPLVPIGDEPAIAHVARRLAQGGLDRAVVNVHHLARAFTTEVLARLPLELVVVHEPEILGTGGGIANAAPLLDEGDVLLWNADVLVDLDVEALVAAHRASGADATFAMAPRSDRAGTLGLGADGQVVRLRGERYGEEVASGDFLGIHVMSPRIRATLRRPGDCIEDGYQPALRAGLRVGTFAVTEPWQDIGSIASYLAANRWWLARRGLSSFVHRSAQVAPGVELDGVVVGEGAVVGGTGALADVVVWPGAMATAPARSAIFWRGAPPGDADAESRRHSDVVHCPVHAVGH